MEKGKGITVDESYAALSSLRPGSRFTIKALMCRRWDVTNAFGKYKSTEYILSDDQGNAIQCSARSNISHCFVSKLEEGVVYSLKDFSVVPNKDKYRVRNTDACVIELEGYTVVRKLACSSDAFERFPFQLTAIEEIRANDSAYLIDVLGCVVDVGAVRTTKTGTELLEFHLMNDKGSRVRVTLWGALCNEFLNRHGHQKGSYIIILPSMNIKDYQAEIYLSSTSTTAIFDSPDIQQISALQRLLREYNTPAKNSLPPPSVPRTVTVAQLICLGRDQKESRRQTLTLQCKVRIAAIRTKDSWFYNACGLGGCKRRVARVGTGFWCETCKKPCDFPRTSFRLHVEAMNVTGSVILTLFDDAAELLLKKPDSMFLEETMDETATHIVPPDLLALVDTCHTFEMKTHTFFDKKSYVSFTVNRVIQAGIHDQTLCGQHKRTRDEEGQVDVSSNPKKLCTNEDHSIVSGVLAEGSTTNPDVPIVKNTVPHA